MTRKLKGNPTTGPFSEAVVKELGDYRAISKRLRITIVEVRALEAETLKAIAAARKNQEQKKDL